MMATALSPRIGHEKAAAVVQRAMDENISLRQAVVDSGLISGDRIANPRTMVGNPRKDVGL